MLYEFVVNVVLHCIATTIFGKKRYYTYENNGGDKTSIINKSVVPTNLLYFSDL